MTGNPLQHTRASAQFPDPFMDMASTAMPKDIKEALRWCQFIVSKNGTYREALRRVVSYFLTDIEISAKSSSDSASGDLSDAEKQKYREFLNDTLGVKTHLAAIAMDYMVYGNSFTSLIIPFRRSLGCPKCGREAPIKEVYENKLFNFKWENFKFHATCPRCNYTGEFRRMDRKSNEPERIRIKRWSPLELDLIHDYYSDTCKYIWRIPPTYKQDIRRGELFHLQDVPWEIVRTVAQDKLFEFSSDAMHHMKEEALAGLVHRGYGISRVLANLPQAWYCQILHRYNEAIAMDFIVPHRVISPATRSGASAESSDPLTSMYMGDFVSQVHSMLRDHREDPTNISAFPFPINYQMLGGEANQLAPHELINQGLKTLLDAIGVPMELYSGTLTAQSAPSSLRLFEANWSHLVHQLNRFLQYVVDTVSKVMSWEPVVCRLTRVTHADDLNRQMAKLQLMQAGQISKSTGLASIGLQHNDESRIMMDEDKEDAKLQERMKNEMEQDEALSSYIKNNAQAAAQNGAGGQAAGGGAAPAAAASPMAAASGTSPASTMFAAGQKLIPNAPTTVEELDGIAQSLAQQAMQMPSRSQRVSFMMQLRKENPTIHSLVKSKIDDVERQAALQGRDMVLQQQFGQQQ